jgi:hypothetical protein
VESWRFFLNATGIGNEQPGVLEQVNEVGVVEGFDEMKTIVACGSPTTQFGFGGGAHVGIGMNGEDGGDIVVLADKVAQSAQVLAHDPAKAFAAVSGENDELLAGGELQKFGGSGRRFGVFQDELQGIDDRIACDENAGFGNAFGEQGGSVSRGGCEVVRHDLGNEAAVHLLRKRAERVAGTQACLDVADRNAMVKSRKRSREGGSGVTLDQDECGSFALDNRFETRHYSRADLVRRLVGLHYLEILIQLDAEEIEEGVEQAGVLAGADDESVQVGAGFQSAEDWREFNDLGARAEDAENPRPGSTGLAQGAAGLGIERLRGVA